jgi:tellurite resistance protein TerC
VVLYFLYEHNMFGLGKPEPGGGWPAAMTFFAGYLVELSLSLDNIFVIAVIFSYFRVPRAYHHRVLFWGILSAVVLRMVMILIGAALFHYFDWINYVFGLLLLWAAYKMLGAHGEEVDVGSNILVRIARRLLPVSNEYDGSRFLTRIDGRLAMTPLMIVLLVVEGADVMFAVDSIPAIFVFTQDPFLIFTSNVFAILGLRSMYFALAALLQQFRYLKYSLVFLLAFIGAKMLLKHVYHIPLPLSLGVIILALAAGFIVSMIATRAEAREKEADARLGGLAEANPDVAGDLPKTNEGAVR